MCMRPQEPLWVLIWLKKLLAATPLRSVPHPVTKLHLNHAADFDRRPNIWFSSVHLTLPDVFQVVSLRKEVAERFHWQAIFFSGLKLCAIIPACVYVFNNLAHAALDYTLCADGYIFSACVSVYRLSLHFTRSTPQPHSLIRGSDIKLAKGHFHRIY